MVQLIKGNRYTLKKQHNIDLDRKNSFAGAYPCLAASVGGKGLSEVTAKLNVKVAEE